MSLIFRDYVEKMFLIAGKGVGFFSRKQSKRSVDLIFHKRWCMYPKFSILQLRLAILTILRRLLTQSLIHTEPTRVHTLSKDCSMVV